MLKPLEKWRVYAAEMDTHKKTFEFDQEQNEHTTDWLQVCVAEAEAVGWSEAERVAVWLQLNEGVGDHDKVGVGERERL